MLINQRAVRRFLHEQGKGCGAGFLISLEARVKRLVIQAAQNARQFKRVTDAELLTMEARKK